MHIYDFFLNPRNCEVVHQVYCKAAVFFIGGTRDAVQAFYGRLGFHGWRFMA